MTRRLVRAVDHRRPIHDGFCRCRTCKPPLVGQHARTRRDRALLLFVASTAWVVAILNSTFWRS